MDNFYDVIMDNFYDKHTSDSVCIKKHHYCPECARWWSANCNMCSCSLSSCPRCMNTSEVFEYEVSEVSVSSDIDGDW